jgi:hypothetical protein
MWAIRTCGDCVRCVVSIPVIVALLLATSSVLHSRFANTSAANGYYNCCIKAIATLFSDLFELSAVASMHVSTCGILGY